MKAFKKKWNDHKTPTCLKISEKLQRKIARQFPIRKCNLREYGNGIIAPFPILISQATQLTGNRFLSAMEIPFLGCSKPVKAAARSISGRPRPITTPVAADKQGGEPKSLFEELFPSV